MIDARLKEFFFDRAAVIDAVGRAGVGFLSKSLGTIRKIARNSMKPGVSKKGKKRASVTGKPPQYFTRLLKDDITYGFDPRAMNGLAGPTLKKNGGAALLEHGGNTTILNRRTGKTVSAHYRGNAYMAPALAKEIPKMPDYWTGSVRGNS